MKSSLQYFLVAAEEMNITQAAKRLYISQQSLSNHIKRLETEYNTHLFYRHPRLTLTPAGETLLNSLRQIKIIENALTKQLDESNNECKGEINIGIAQTRATLLIPNIIPNYISTYPNIQLHVVNGNTNKLISELKHGNLDLFVGISHPLDKELQYINIRNERTFVAISDELLSAFFPGSLALLQNRFKNGVNIKDFEPVPFVINTNSETFYPLLSAITNMNNTRLKIPFQIDDTYTRAQLCKSNFGASIFTESMLEFIFQINAQGTYNSHINIFPLNRLATLTYPLVIAYHANAYLPPYLSSFIDRILDYYHKQGEQIKSMV